MGDQGSLAAVRVRRSRSSAKRGLAAVAFIAALSVIGAGTFSSSAAAEPVRSAGPAGIMGQEPIVLAQAGGTEPRELEPAYAPPAPGKPGPYNEAEGPGYNSDYLFGITRATASSTIVPAAKVPLFLLTVPLDLALLPFAAIGGFFG